MRIALDTSTEVGNRSARVLLGDQSVQFVGVINAAVPKRRRSGPASDLNDFDVVVSDGTSDFHSLIGRASVADIPLVLWIDDPGIAPGEAPIPIIHGANVATTLTAALRSHPAASPSADDRVRVAWTEPGKPHRAGEHITFPEPVGNQWAKKRGTDQFVAFVDNEWGAAVVDVDGFSGRRIVGVSDHAAYMEAMVLSATALVAAGQPLERSVVAGSALGPSVLASLERVELEVAVWTAAPTP